ncbi:MAG: hypothetical protein GF421_10380 [Candidatus Aminicenantes bacterium]|nr:hypothetical protein [Candidatus Aminicenantes bacterium]
MKNRASVMGILILFMGLTCFCVKKTPELNTDDVMVLLSNISESPLEMTIKAEPSEISIERGDKKSQYRILLKDPEVRFSTVVYKHMNMEFPEFEVPLTIKKLVMLYEPSEKNLKLKSAEKIKCDLELSEWVTDLDSQEMTIHYQLESALLEGYDISSLLDSKHKSFPDLLTELISINNQMNMNAKGFSMNFSGQGEQSGTVDFFLKSMESSFQAEPELVTAFLKKEDVDGILSGLVDKKVPLIDLETSFEGMDFVFDSPEKKLKAGFQEGGFSYSLVPSQDEDVFDFSSRWKMKGVTTEGMPEQIEIFSRLNELNIEFSIDSLSSGFVRAYFDLIKTAQSMKKAKDEEAQQEMMMKGPVLASEFIKSKPVLKISLSPLDHDLGKIEAQGEFQFVRMGPPTGKAEATIQDMRETEQIIRKTLAPERAQAFIKWIKQMFQVDDSGQGRMVFELKKEDPAHFYLNGEQHLLK